MKPEDTFNHLYTAIKESVVFIISMMQIILSIYLMEQYTKNNKDGYNLIQI